jgi:hypothetical protein
LVQFSILKRGTAHSSKSFVPIYQNVCCHTLEYSDLCMKVNEYL